MSRHPQHRLLLLVVLLLLFPSPARADAGVPMLALVWPASWALLIPIILVEALVARRILGLGWKEAARRAGIANLASTLVGIPLTWGVLVVIEMLFQTIADSATTVSRLLNTIPGKIATVFLTAPWLVPYEDELDWMVPAAALLLIVPFLFVSVWVERRYFDRKKELPSELVKTWSWRANLLSYGMLAVCLAVLLGWVLVTRTPDIVVLADFNGDGIEDEARLVQRQRSSYGMGLSALVSEGGSARRYHGIVTDPRLLEGKSIRLAPGPPHPGIEVFGGKAPSIFFYWSDTKQEFERAR